MGTVKRRPLTRRVAFTDKQAFIAKGTGKFPSHREFVDWLFQEQHKAKVINFETLEYRYVKPKVGQSETITYVTGHIGLSIGWM
jgi:hypothetical protein